MADKYIDQDEVKIYGPYATKRIRKWLVGRLPQYDSALDYCADQIDTATLAVTSAVEDARDKDADLRKGATDKKPLLQEAISLLGRFSKHLSGHARDTIDRKVYFTKDGTAGGVGRSAQNVTLAVTHIARKLGATGCQVRDRTHWKSLFDDMSKALSPAVAFADDARTDRALFTPDVDVARQAWLNTYQATKLTVEGVLRHLGRLEQLSRFFYDMQVPSGAKVTEMPPDEPSSPLIHAPEDEAQVQE